MSQCVLLTGATGFLGGHTLRALLADSHRVVVLKREQSDAAEIAGLGDAVTLVDIEAVPLTQCLAEHVVEAVVHLACHQGRGDVALSALIETNVLLGVRLLEAARECGVKRFVNADTQLEPEVNAYARSKKQFAQWLPVFEESMSIANLRLGNIYGPGEPTGGFLSWLIGEFGRAPAAMDFTPGEQLRDFVHAADVSSAVVTILGQMNSPGLETYDVGSGQMRSLRGFVEAAQAAYQDCAGPQESALNFGGLAYREGEVMKPEFDTGPLMALGWGPNYSLEQGLRETIEAQLAAQSA